MVATEMFNSASNSKSIIRSFVCRWVRFEQRHILHGSIYSWSCPVVFTLSNTRLAFSLSLSPYESLNCTKPLWKWIEKLRDVDEMISCSLNRIRRFLCMFSAHQKLPMLPMKQNVSKNPWNENRSCQKVFFSFFREQTSLKCERKRKLNNRQRLNLTAAGDIRLNYWSLVDTKCRCFSIYVYNRN